MTIKYRQAGLEDTYSSFLIFRQALEDLSVRLNVQAITAANDPDIMVNLWERRRPHFEHIARTSEHNWLAEKDGQPVGYARSILRDGVLQLTEFFVVPGAQSAGVGRELLTRALPPSSTYRRVILASVDMRAQARYLKAGVSPLFPVYYFSHLPQQPPINSDLTFEPVAASPTSVETIGAIDKAILGYRRDVDHEWLLGYRQGYLYRRNDQPVGYGYVPKGDNTSGGPFVLLDQADFPAVLAHAENEAHKRDASKEYGFEVPMINRTAAEYLLSRHYEIDSFFEFFMTDAPERFGGLANAIITSPPFFL